MGSSSQQSQAELQQALDFFKEKCSICFDNRCEFCFPGCEDQFCFNCVRRYFKEVVDNSWGLSGCKMKCPVCYAVLPKEVWTKYADRKTIQRYESFNRPFRPFSRHCSICSEEVAVAKPPALDSEGQKRIIEHLLDLVRAITEDEEEVFHQIHQEIMLVIGKRKTVFELYQSAMRQLQDHINGFKVFSDSIESRSEKRRKVNEVNEEKLGAALSILISLESDADKWRQLQHHHVRLFPKKRCDSCNSQLCFHCGEPTWHLDSTCKDNLKRKLLVTERELSATIEWTIANGKRCPNCSVLINRDDGCNKMDCLHCGFSFCWVCEGPWSTLCGFYKCANEPQDFSVEIVGETVPAEGSALSPSPSPSSSPSPPLGSESPPRPNKRPRPSEDAAPEIGVPNVVQIERRMSLIIQERSFGSPWTPVVAAPMKRRFAKDWHLFSRHMLV